MFDITKYEVVAMLRLPDGERKWLCERAEELTESFDSLDMIYTEGSEPLISVLDMHTILREDVSEKLLTRDEIMAATPKHHNGYFQVPGTLE